MMLRLLLVLTLLLPATARADVLRMAVTTSFANSGLSDSLLPAIARDLGIEVQLVIVGTGQALRLGAAGDVDAVLTHAPDAEEAFVAAGHAARRIPVMANDFVLIGPAADPAGIGATESAAGALAAIAAARAPFVSRGDDSGTHLAELALWEAVGIAPEGNWYRPVGAGMGAALNTAAAMDAYILSDRATWLAFRNPQNLAILFQGDPILFNPYAFMAVSREKGPHIRADAAERLEAWLTGPNARALIADFTVAGQPVFFLPDTQPSYDPNNGD
jgi:tungstate transport system substrate-binding protein